LLAKTVVVRITDHGPYRRRRIIDMSRAAARELDMIDCGTTMVSAVRQ
jgi:rare lipoprotein A